MEWSDEAIVLSSRPHGEAAAVATLLTRRYGRHAGLVQGARGVRQRGVLEPGNRVGARWRGRLPEHLGAFSLELERSAAAGLLDHPQRLAALVSACAVCEAALPERQPHEAVYDGFCALLTAFDSEFWDAAYVRWEVGVLRELGFGLDLSRCAATGANDQLAYVSPRTGRAVSFSAAEGYRERLLPLPGFLIARGPAEPDDVLAGLRLTGHFLERTALAAGGIGLPAARARFIERYRKNATPSGK